MSAPAPSPRRPRERVGGILIVLGANLLVWMFAAAMAGPGVAALLGFSASIVVAAIVGGIAWTARRRDLAIGVGLGFLFALLLWPGQCLIAGAGGGYHP